VEFLVGFDVNVPDGAARAEVEERLSNEAATAAKLAEEGHLIRIWKPPVAPGEAKALGLYRADSRRQLDGLLGALPLADWMRVTVTALEPHPNDPANGRPDTFELPGPRLTPVYRLQATLGAPLDLGDTAQTDAGDLFNVQSRSVRHGSAEVLARLARGEDVDASEYTFRTSTTMPRSPP
jgi:muconolactone delta-isomerase